MIVLGKDHFHTGSPVRPVPDTFPGAQYIVNATYRVTLGRPRVAFAATDGLPAHFSGMNRYPTGEILLRINCLFDQVGAVGAGKHLVSTDNGQSFPLSSLYFVDGSHTSAEPLTLMSDGVYRGGTFAPADYNRPGGDLRSVRCYYQEISNGGRTYSKTANACLIQGFPLDIGVYGSEVGFSWFGDIVQISNSQWISLAIPQYASAARVNCECIESTDQGHTWNVVGHLAGDEVGGEGFDEPALLRMPSGRFIAVSRVGVTRIVRKYSDDLGRTWNDLQTLTPWCLAPRLTRVSGTGDYVITTGAVTQASINPYGTRPNGDSSYLALPQSYAPARLGLYISSDPMSLMWPVVDLIAHHNSYGNFVYDYSFPSIYSCSGYTSIVEISPNRLLICYDQRPGPDRVSRVFVVDAYIERIVG